jgi:tetratricopeptide (TPR) repeat protein
MFQRKKLVYALIAAGMASGVLLGESGTANDDTVTEATVGLANPLCVPADPKARQSKAFFKIAEAKNELRPFVQTEAIAEKNDETILFENLGTLHYRITTQDPLAQKFFDQGLRLTYAFNHAEARRAFRKAQELDSQCAMCYWGEALVLGPNINAPMEASATAPALAAVQKAQALASKASPSEQALIDALAVRYSDDANAERAQLDAAYADAMKRVHTRFPKDSEIALLYAESLMDLSPWDYWEAGGAKPKGATSEIIAALERMLKANPDHPGAIHYYIHMVEASSNPKRAEPYARRLAKAMPGAGHVVHMPFHIFYRIGKYRDALEANRMAVAVDEAYISRAAPAGIYPQAYYPHNVHSLMASAQMAGDGKTAIAAAEKLSQIVSSDAAREIPWVQPIMAAPYFAHAQFSAPATVLALPDPGDDFPFVKAAWHYARGVAYAALGAVPGAEQQAQAIMRLREDEAVSKLASMGIPAADVLKLAAHIVSARIAQASGDLKTAISEFEQAVAIQDGLAYSEPAYWYYPVRQSLGAMLALAGDFDRAEQTLRLSLARNPNNGWALYGLKEVYKKRGDARGAREIEKLLAKAWVGQRENLDLARL